MILNMEITLRSSKMNSASSTITAINNDKICTWTIYEFKRDVMLCKTILSSAIADGYLKVGQVLNGWEIVDIN